MTVSAAVRLMPRPPARVESRKIHVVGSELKCCGGGGRGAGLPTRHRAPSLSPSHTPSQARRCGRGGAVWAVCVCGGGGRAPSHPARARGAASRPRLGLPSSGVTHLDVALALLPRDGPVNAAYARVSGLLEVRVNEVEHLGHLAEDEDLGVGVGVGGRGRGRVSERLGSCLLSLAC
jgi:hypothetical protein